MRGRKERQDAEIAASARRRLLCDGIAIADENFRLIALDSGAEAILNDLNEHRGRSDEGVTFPRELIDLLQNTRGEPYEKHLHVSVADREYSCQTFVLKPRTEGDSQTKLGFYFKLELSITDAVHQVGVDYNLTDREQEALIGVTMGLTSKELATRMDISPNTVKAFLRLIMIKMGVTTRAGIVGKVLEENGYFKVATSSKTGAAGAS